MVRLLGDWTIGGGFDSGLLVACLLVDGLEGALSD